MVDHSINVLKIVRIPTLNGNNTKPFTCHKNYSRIILAFIGYQHIIKTLNLAMISSVFFPMNQQKKCVHFIKQQKKLCQINGSIFYFKNSNNT